MIKSKLLTPKRGRYRATLTNKCLGTRWWAFAGPEESEGVRLRAWAEPKAERADPELKEEMELERKVKYGNGPVTMGGDPATLAILVEGGEVEFEVV